MLLFHMKYHWPRVETKLPGPYLGNWSAIYLKKKERKKKQILIQHIRMKTLCFGDLKKKTRKAVFCGVKHSFVNS